MIERSVKGTGMDYCLGHAAEGPPSQNKARLDISGILNAGAGVRDAERAITRRVAHKLQQVKASSGSLPAYVAVLEFGRPLGEVRRR